jgi:diguanylate cyclase (GGDEF)-like protein
VTLRARIGIGFVVVLVAPAVLASFLLAGEVWAAVGALLAGGLLASVLAWWLAGVAIRPLDCLLDAVERAGSGDLTARCHLRGRDETGRLGAGLDRLIAEAQEARLLSVTDALTGLGNLRHLRDELRLEIERANRFGRTLGVLVLDLDHFKTVNDRYGHGAGDAVLVEFSRRVRGIVREVDPAFRQGGEEFVILLPETDVAGSVTAARRIRDAVRERPFPVRCAGPGVTVSVTVSIGVAVFPRHALTEVEVLHAADQALYAAKTAGRDTYALALPGQRVGGLAPAGGASGGTTSARASRDG